MTSPQEPPVDRVVGASPWPWWKTTGGDPTTPVDKDAMPSPLSWELTSEQQDNISEWLTKRVRQELEGNWRCTCVTSGCSYESYGGPDPECPMHRQPVDKATEAVDVMAEVRRLARSQCDNPPIRTEPIKLTPGQWDVLRRNIPGPAYDPRLPYGDVLGNFTGTPVVMVDSEAESTLVLEGWIKPKRRRWWQRLWHWRRL